MRLVNSEYNLQIELKENNVYEMIVENNHAMSRIVSSLIEQQNGTEGSFLLSVDNKTLKWEKTTEILLDYFNFTLNNKKIVTKLFSNAEKYAESECIEERNEINSKIVSLLDTITTGLGYTDTIYSLDFKWTDLFKMYDLKLIDSYESIVEKLCMYIRLLADFTDVKVLFLIQIRAFLSTEDLSFLYQCAAYSKITLILIESRECDVKNGEKRYIIDKDLCLIQQ